MWAFVPLSLEPKGRLPSWSLPQPPLLVLSRSTKRWAVKISTEENSNSSSSKGIYSASLAQSRDVTFFFSFFFSFFFFLSHRPPPFFK